MKEKILMYQIDADEKTILQHFFQDAYDVVDEDDCFTDVLAIPAAAIFVNPNALTEDELAQMNELFQWDHDTMLAFIAKPRNPESIRFTYYYEDDLERLRDRKYLQTEESPV